jgi:glutathione reductase (NADPH)
MLGKGFEAIADHHGEPISEEVYDLLTIGAGSGGVAASRRAALHGARVAICEDDRVGGTCVIRGCVPKKLLTYAAGFADAFADAPGFGWTVKGVEFDWARLIAHKDREIDRLNQLYLEMLAKSNVTLLPGRGRLIAPQLVEVAGRLYRARKVIVATGARAQRLAIPGAEFAITSDDALSLSKLPEQIAIIGAGYIACEFAGIFQGLGAQVSMIYRGAWPLRGWDMDIRQALAREMAGRGIRLFPNTVPQAITPQAPPSTTPYALSLVDGQALKVDQVMFATGRLPNSAGLGLEALGVECQENGAIIVDGQSRTKLDWLYAIGDVTDRKALTPVAIAEGRALVDHLFGGQSPRELDYRLVASAVFSQPPAAMIGLSEEEARQHYGEKIEIYRTVFRPMKHALSGRQEKVLIKLVVEGHSQKILGAHMLGGDAPEIMQAAAIAVTMGASKPDFDRTIAVHPTSAEELVLLREKISSP